MAKSDLQARPIFHQTRETIEAIETHLTLVFAALTISKNIESLTVISIKQFVKLLRTIRSSIVVFNRNEILAEPIIPESVSELLKKFV